MNDNATVLAARITESGGEFIALVEACDDAQWRRVVPDEGWSVGFVARHVGWGMRAHRRLIDLAQRGDALPELTMAEIDEANRTSLESEPHPQRERTLRFLRRELTETMRLVNSLDDGALARTAHLAFLSPDALTIDQIISRLFIWHITSHTSSVRLALA